MNKYKNLITTCIVFIIVAICSLNYAQSGINKAVISPWAHDYVNRAIYSKLVPEDLQEKYSKNITRDEFCRLAISFLSAKTEMSVNEMARELDIDMSKNKFTDTDKDYIIFANKIGIINGKTKTTFDPNAPLTRQEAAKILANACKITGKFSLKKSELVFLDDDIEDWAKDSIMLVYNLKIMNGVSKTKFAPNQHYTREQSIVTLVRMYDLYKDYKPVKSQ